MFASVLQVPREVVMPLERDLARAGAAQVFARGQQPGRMNLLERVVKRTGVTLLTGPVFGVISSSVSRLASTSSGERSACRPGAFARFGPLRATAAAISSRRAKAAKASRAMNSSMGRP